MRRSGIRKSRNLVTYPATSPTPRLQQTHLLYCPLCGAEYRPGFTVCSDCQVALVPDPPGATSANASNDTSDEKSFAQVWSGNDSRLHDEICQALDREKIPARTLGSKDHLFNFNRRPTFEIYVPADLVNSAREALTSLGSRAGHMHHDGVEVDIKNEDLASLADVNFFTLSHILGAWEKQKVVSKNRGKVLIRCPEKMLAA